MFGFGGEKPKLEKKASNNNRNNDKHKCTFEQTIWETISNTSPVPQEGRANAHHQIIAMAIAHTQ